MSRPSLSISASQIRQEVNNNRSLVRLTLRLHSTYYINFSAKTAGSLNGQSFTYGSTGSGTWTIRTRDIWVPHNSDGTKTYNYSGWYDLNITYSGSWMGRQSASGSIALSRIPRQSSLTSASMNANLKPGTANRIDVGISNHANFGHWFDVMYGNTAIRSFQSTGKPNNIPLEAGHVNQILSLSKTTANPVLTVRMSTRSGNTLIGSVVSRNLTATIDASVKPSISSHSTSIYGTGYDKTINRYVEGITRVAGKFTRSAGYGATVSGTQITIEKTDGTNRQVINSNDGVTGTTIAGNGNYRAIAYVRDSRGRTSTHTNTFTVTPYSQPRINEFTAERPNEKGTTINTKDSGVFSNLGGLNKLNVKVQYKASTASTWSTARDVMSTSGTFGNTARATGVREDNSCILIITVVDSFGKEATSERSVGTAKTVFAINKNLGVGIGKRHERGELDVAGDVYISNDGILSIDTENGTFTTFKPDGDVAFAVGATKRGDTTYSKFQVLHNGDVNVGGLLRVQGYSAWGGHNIDSGSNENGHYIKYPDGTMICWISDYRHFTIQTADNWAYRTSGSIRLDLPATFINENYSITGSIQTGGRVGYASFASTYIDYFRFYPVTERSSNGSLIYNFIAIGRWK